MRTREEIEKDTEAVQRSGRFAPKVSLDKLTLEVLLDIRQMLSFPIEDKFPAAFKALQADQECDCGCHYSDFAYRGGKNCGMCGHQHH